MVKWYSSKFEPENSKSILLRFDEKNDIHYIGDYSYNLTNEYKNLDWNGFKAFILLTRHSDFEWCYWIEVEKMLNEDRNED